MDMGSNPIKKKWNAVLIKQLRGKRTQEEFARLLGAPKNTVWRWEAGYVVPTTRYARKLSALATREGFLANWKAVGSIVWVGDLDAGSKDILREFSRTVARR
jgi:DNA-binding XRE family transcriptional regulator